MCPANGGTLTSLPIIATLRGHENINTTPAFYAFATIDMTRECFASDLA